MRFRELNAGMPGTYKRIRKLCPQSWVPRLMSRTVLGPFMSSFLSHQHGPEHDAPPDAFGCSVPRTDPSLLRMKTHTPEPEKTPW
jgi:hypothetical protein